MTHVEHKVEEDEDGNKNEVLACGEIPAEELAKRKNDYQKNLFCSEYMRNTDKYIQDLYSGYTRSVAAAYAKKTGREVFNDYGRTLMPYLVGKSAKEIIKVIDIMQTGTEEQKDMLWRGVVNEAFKVNPNERMTSDPKVFYRNAAYQSRLSKILTNLAGKTDQSQKYIKDEYLKKKAEGFYNAGCTMSSFMGPFNEASRSTIVGGLGLENWFKANFDDIQAMVEQLEENPGGDEIEYRIGNKTYTLPKDQAYMFHTSVNDLWAARDYQTENIGQRMFPGEVRDSGTLVRYNEYKKMKLITPLSSGDIKEITQSYNAVKKAYEEKPAKEPEKAPEAKAEAKAPETKAPEEPKVEEKAEVEEPKAKESPAPKAEEVKPDDKKKEEEQSAMNEYDYTQSAAKPAPAPSGSTAKAFDELLVNLNIAKDGFLVVKQVQSEMSDLDIVNAILTTKGNPIGETSKDFDELLNNLNTPKVGFQYVKQIHNDWTDLDVINAIIKSR